MIAISTIYILLYISIIWFFRLPIKQYASYLYTLLFLLFFSIQKHFFGINSNLIDYLFYFFVFSLSVISIQDRKNKLYIAGLLFITEMILAYLFPEQINILTGALIFLYTFFNIRDTLWVFSTVLNSIGVIYKIDFAEIYFLSVFIIMIKKLAEDIKESLEREKRQYRTKLNQQIDKEINQKLDELNEEIGIINKKVKNLFELSNYTISTNSVEDLAERVVKGLKNLGYTGVLFFIDKSQQLFKEGFFPNLLILLKDIKKSLKNTEVIEDKYIFIPIYTENERIGFIGIYKKSGISQDEVEYLSIYANTISIFLEKVYYSKEITKLKELTYRILEAIDIGIAVIDKDFKILFKNKAFERFTNKSSENLFDAIPRLRILEDEFKNVIKSKGRFETVLSSTKQGEYIYQVKAFPTSLYNSSDIDSFILLLEDITEKEELEAHVVQTEKLAILGKLVAGLSHDIRNPLAAISQAAFRIKKISSKKNDLKLEELAKVIEKNVERTSDIMERLLNFSKPANQKAEILNINSVIDESIELSLVRKHEVNIEKNIEKDIYIYGDKNALIHAFVNIIINALEAMDYKGTLSISAFNRNNKVIIEVKDTGKGIPEHVKNRIFEPFFTTKDQGTGLGLFITYKVIKEHGGNITLKETSKNGTTFIIELPAVEEP